jgi:hypothetical protein
MTGREFEFLAASCLAWSRRPVHATLIGNECCAAVARIRLIAGSANDGEMVVSSKERLLTRELVLVSPQTDRAADHG